MSINTLDITPSPRVLRMLGEIPFQTWQCIAELVDNYPACEYGTSEGTAVSRLLSCEQNLSNGQSRRVGQRMRTDHSEFESGYGTNRLSDVVNAALTADRHTVAQKIKEDVFRLLDPDRRDLCVPALFDIIASDTLINTEKAASFQTYVGMSKSALLSPHKIYLPELLAGLLIYVVAAVVNTEGKQCAKKIDKSEAFELNDYRQIGICEGKNGNQRIQRLQRSGDSSALYRSWLDCIYREYASVGARIQKLITRFGCIRGR